MDVQTAELPVFDQADLLETVSGDQAVLMVLVGFYVEEIPGEVAILTKMVDEGDLEGAGELAHKLKGSSRNMRARQMGETFSLIESAVKSRRTDEVAALLVRLHEGFELFKRFCSELGLA